MVNITAGARKAVVYRKTSNGYTVRTPNETRSFSNDSHAAKAFFRAMLLKFRQVYIPRPKRKRLAFNDIITMTTFQKEVAQQ